jgi:Family of unknown function (DUF6174)
MPVARRTVPVLASALLLLAGCSLLPGSTPTVPEPVAVPPAGPIGPGDLAAQRAIWDAQAIDDYRWDVSFECECLLNGATTVTVVDGIATGALNNGQPVELAGIEGFPLTIEAVFDAAAATLRGGGTVDATWGAGGLPTRLRLDRDVQAVDDELGIVVGSVTPAR